MVQGDNAGFVAVGTERKALIILFLSRVILTLFLIITFHETKYIRLLTKVQQNLNGADTYSNLMKLCMQLTLNVNLHLQVKGYSTIKKFQHKNNIIILQLL